jgi:tetratricopeptide (TPR) repeat protein
MGESEKAKKVLSIALKIANVRAAANKEETPILDETVAQLNVSICHVKLACVAIKMKLEDSSLLSLQQAVEGFNVIARKLSNETDDTLIDHKKHLEFIVNNGLATAWHLLGKMKMDKNDQDHAMKCFQKTFEVLNKTNDSRIANGSNSLQTSLPFASCLFWEGPTALVTAQILTDANQYSGEISPDESLRCVQFQRSIEIREAFVSNLGLLQSIDSENALECFDESQWDVKNMNCYLSLLEILKSRGIANSEGSMNEIDTSDTTLTKEDVLFRLGNVQAKLGLVKEAIESYKEAELSTVKCLGTKDHIIVSNILHNLGNAYRQLSISAATPRQKDNARESSLKCYSDSIRIATTLFGPRHISLADSLHSQGLLYMGLEQPWFNVIYEEEYDEDDEEIALDCLKRSLAIRKKDKDTGNDLEVASTQYLLGNLCLRMIGRSALRLDADTSKLAGDAISYFIESLKIQNLLLGDDHADVANTLQGLGQAHLLRALSAKDKANKANDEHLDKAFETLNSSLDLRVSIRKNAASVPTDQLIVTVRIFWVAWNKLVVMLAKQRLISPRH